MTDDSKTKVEKADRVLLIERAFDAPRESVWKAWTEKEHLSQWWGPKGWTVPFCEVDLRPGGAWRYCMGGPDGEEAWGKAVYREIAAPGRLVYTDYFTDAEGNVLDGMPSMVITVEFIEENGKTLMRSRSEYQSAADLESVLAMGMVEGMTETLDRLEELLAKIAA